MKPLTQRLRATKLFSLLSIEQLERLVENSSTHEARAGDVINALDEPLIDHLVLTDGEIRVTHRWVDDSGEEKKYERSLTANENDGEVSIFGAAGKGISVEAASDCRYLLIDGDSVDEMLGWNQQFSDVLRKDKSLEKRMGAVKRVNIFLKLPVENVKEAFRRMVPRDFAEGDTVVKEGEQGDCYYLIDDGQAEVWRTDPFTDETSCVATLGPGDAFGEEALLQNGMRNATVKMITPGRLMRLEKSDFEELVQPGMVEEVDADSARDLVGHSKAALLDCRYDVEFEESRLPGAQWIPLDQIREGVDQLDSNLMYIVYCRSGRRSKAAAFLLKERNIEAVSLTGGIRDWPYDVDAAPIN